MGFINNKLQGSGLWQCNKLHTSLQEVGILYII